MVREYELMYIVRPELDEEALQASVESVKTLVTAQGGEITKTTMWGKRRLAYEVKHLRDGHYVILKLTLDGTKVAAIERNLRIHDTVFRHMLVVDEIGATAETEEERERASDEYAAKESRGAATESTETDAVATTADDGDADAPETEDETTAVPVGAAADDEEEN